MDGFGERLINARKNKNLSQRQLAEILEVTPTCLNYWEKDKREPNLSCLIKLSEALDTDIYRLLGLVKEEAKPIAKEKKDEAVWLL